MKRRLLLPVLAILVLSVPACSFLGTDDTSDLDADDTSGAGLSFFETAESVPYEELEASFVTLGRSPQGSYAFTDRENLVLTDAAAFESLWVQLHAHTEPAPPVPSVDFSEEVVIGVFLGLRSSGGYAVEIQQVGSSRGVVGVHVEERAPGSDCVTTSVMTSPYHLVKARVRPTEIRFIDTKRTVSCGE